MTTIGAERMEIRVLFERFGEEGWFFVSSPDVLGLMLCGPDEEELLDEIPHALSLLVSGVARQAVTRAKQEARSSGWKTRTVSLPFGRPEKLAAVG
jgi:predicted RNase H-like HicB family nuclease